MHLSLLLLFLSLTLTPPLSAAASPPWDQSHFTKHRLHHRNTTEPPKEFIEVRRPLPFDSLTPSCTLPILSYTFGNTIELPPTNTTYSPPANCTWSNVVLHLSGASNGSQYDRIAAVWLSGVEILRTSTPEPTPDGIFWNVRKDVTKYSSLLRQSNLTLSVMLENVLDDVYTGAYRVNLTLLYYNVSRNGTNGAGVNSSHLFLPNRRSTNRDSDIKPLELKEIPADLIIPVSASGEDGFWFKIKSESDAVYQGIQIPLNTYKAVIEVYVSFHGDDEYWYSNPPDSYIEMNGLSTRRGHGAYREVQVKLDDNIAGSVIPFPVIFTGGINPLFWDPVVSIGAFDLPSYEIELTPFLGILLDGKVHYFGLVVADAISYWLVDANLHLWLDDKADKVQAGAIKYEDSNSCVEREYEFQQLNGEFEIEAKKESEFSGWVNSSAGNFTTHIKSEFKFKNKIKFTNAGTKKSVEQEVEVKDSVKLKSTTGSTLSIVSVETKYPLKISTISSLGSVDGTYLMTTKLENSLKEELKVKDQQAAGQFESSTENSQESNGWMFVQDHDVLSGAATTTQDYTVEDSFGCFTWKVSAASGSIGRESKNFLCAVAAS